LTDADDDSLEPPVPAWLDADGDGFGDPANPVAFCSPQPGMVLNDSDCDDTRQSVAPGNPEVCDGLDNDCNGLTDDDDPSRLFGSTGRWYEDLDGDGFGNPFVGARACAQPPSHVAESGDCDDTNPDVSPGAPEVCDGLDNDCDGIPEDADPDLVGGFEILIDSDGDGVGSADNTTMVCEMPSDPVVDDTDCDDFNADTFPGAVEICDKADNDCDGLIDDDDADVDLTTGRIFYVDDDDDGYGVDTITILQCWMPLGFTPQDGDCDDADRSAHPLSYELCDGVDNNCSGLVDDDDPELAYWLYEADGYFQDADGDGYGDRAVPWQACGTPTSGWVLNADDCDDTNSTVWTPMDADGDGFLACDPDPALADCNDGDNTIFPGQVELCNDIDDDCDGHPDIPGAGGDTVALGCDLCPDPDAFDPAVIALETYNPCVLDPAVSNLCADGVYFVDTHTEGERLHKVLYRTDLTEWRDELFVFFPPSKGNNNRNITHWAADVGYKVINLGYDNELKLIDQCGEQPDPCYGPLREETHYGVDATPTIDIGPADSVEGRLATLLAHLEATQPGMGWGTHLDTDGTPLWESIIPVGWSNGSGSAAFAAREARVPASVFIGGPNDPIEGGLASEWVVDATWATPPCALHGIYHSEEIGEFTIDEWQMTWLGMGMDNSVEIDIDRQPYPTWDPTAQIHHTESIVMGADHCRPHKATAFDQCMDVEVLQRPYTNLFCELPLDATCEL
jgi:hypothetical protein